MFSIIFIFVGFLYLDYLVDYIIVSMQEEFGKKQIKYTNIDTILLKVETDN